MTQTTLKTSLATKTVSSTNVYNYKPNYNNVTSTGKEVYNYNINYNNIRKADGAAQAQVHRQACRTSREFRLLAGANVTLYGCDSGETRVTTKFTGSANKSEAKAKGVYMPKKVYYKNRGYALFYPDGSVTGCLHYLHQDLLPPGKYKFYHDEDGVYHFSGFISTNYAIRSKT